MKYILALHGQCLVTSVALWSQLSGTGLDVGLIVFYSKDSLLALISLFDYYFCVAKPVYSMH